MKLEQKFQVMPNDCKTAYIARSLVGGASCTSGVEGCFLEIGEILVINLELTADFVQILAEGRRDRQ